MTDLTGKCGVTHLGARTTAQPMNDNTQLSGVRVLVVEDDPLMAMDLEDTLADAGAVVVGLCRTVDEATARVDADDFAVAVLDFSLGSDTASSVARRMAREAGFSACVGVRRENCSVLLILLPNSERR
jgi:DNA-binding response OmpR family regulator